MLLSKRKDIVDQEDAAIEEVHEQSALSGSFVQLMVFINGIVLTAVVFITLNIFIERIIADNIKTTANQIKENVSNSFLETEKLIDGAANLIIYGQSLEPNQTVENFQRSFLNKDIFSAIFWLKKDGSGRYISYDLVYHGDQREKNVSLHQTIIKKVMSFNEIGIHVMLDGDNVVIGRKVRTSLNNYDVLYGVTSFDKILNKDFFSNNSSLLKFELTKTNTKDVLYAFSNPDIADSKFKHHVAMIETGFASLPLKGYFGLVFTNSEIFLKRILYLSLFFGILLTAVGTLYVYSNRKQSIRLAKMNAELVANNDRLNQEIKERERLNSNIRKQEKDNRAIVDSVSDIIFEISTDGKILFLNESWSRITGFTIDMSLGRNLFDLLYAQDQTEQKNNIALLVAGKKQSYRSFTRLRTSEGNFRSVELAVSMLRQDYDKGLRVVGTITDVEDRRRAERALSEAEKKYRAIVENAATGIYQVTPEGIYLSANPAMAKILGFDITDDVLKSVRNANIDVYTNPQSRERQMQEAIKKGLAIFETQVKKRTGDLIWVNESLRVVHDDQGQISYFEGNMEDVTARKIAEIALKDAKIESDLANRAKSEFLANMSHELRTPLNAIIGFSDIIQTQAFGDVGSPEYLEYSKEINQSGRRLLQVINEILDVSRIEAGDRQLNESLVDLNKIVSSSIEMFASKIEANKLNISNFVNEDSPKIIGESHAIKQMVVNLLSNAVKFTPDGGRISITAQIDNDGQLNLSVIDTGIGLTDEEMEIALSPFGQINASFNRSDSGTGLGLTLVKSLISLHSGSLELFSQKGIGTTATLIFPQKRVSIKSSKVSV